MKMRGMIVAMSVSVCAIVGSGASGQTASFYNGGFDIPCVFCGGPFPEGWQSPGGDPIARRRFPGDGGSPTIFPVGTPGQLTPHTGTGVLEIGTHGTGGFEGLTTDLVNFCYCDQTCQTPCSGPYPFFDPLFDYAQGDVVVSGWYMIPASAPLVGDRAGIKINIKLGFQDVATIEVLDIEGHTNGQWVQKTLVFPKSEIVAHYECNVGIRPMCGCSCVPSSPFPNHTKITTFRFTGDGGTTSGSIYWDDITYVQMPAGPSCDSIDFNNDGVSPDSQDVDDFLSVFGGGPCSNDPNCNDIDFNNDGVSPDSGDIDLLLVVFGGGACV